MLENLQEGTRFFITGHTGFKGTWLAILLKELGYAVYGYSLKEPSFYLSKAVDLQAFSISTFGDVRDKAALSTAMVDARPDVVIHLAAQPLVIESYRLPALTFEVNVQGTINVLEVASGIETVRSILVVTTDKVYKNSNDGKKFKEDDCLMGSDPYSCSKVATEAVANAWRRINSIDSKPKVLVARAGNVIGGGDLSANRLIPDIVRDIRGESKALIRNPKSTRPWQHVLEPLIGYLKYIDKSLHESVPSALNFGPTEQSMSVQEVISVASDFFDLTKIQLSSEVSENLESIRLDLDSNLAQTTISWIPKWSQVESIQRTFSWWRDVLIGGKDPLKVCQSDIFARLSR